MSEGKRTHQTTLLMPNEDVNLFAEEAMPLNRIADADAQVVNEANDEIGGLIVFWLKSSCSTSATSEPCCSLNATLSPVNFA